MLKSVEAEEESKKEVQKNEIKSVETKKDVRSYSDELKSNESSFEQLESKLDTTPSVGQEAVKKY